MIPYAIGLDIGVTSVGWATVALDGDDRPCGIIGMGSRIFTAAEQPKTGESLAAPRREARSMRRRLRRKRHRKERIRALFIQSGLLTASELDHLFDGQLPDIYALRVRALDEPVSKAELARILLHLAQRRGFRSNRKGDTSKEDGELLSAVNANRARMSEKGYRTAAELYLKDEAYREHKRNKGGGYVGTVDRAMIEEEARLIFDSQRRLGNPAAGEELEKEYMEILLGQRSFDDGPASGPYAGSQIQRMMGKCTLEPEEYRAPRASYSFEYFRLLQTVNHLRLTEQGESLPLTEEQRRKVIELAHQVNAPTYARLRKELGLREEQRFNAVSYGKEDVESAEKKAKLNELRAYHQMRGAFEKIAKGHYADITPAQRDAIALALTTYKTSPKIRGELEKAGLSEADMSAAETLNFSKTGHISVKACQKLIPYLEQGMSYDKACEAAGYDFRSHEGTEKTALLPALDEDAKNTITSPVVLRAVSQTIKVVNAIIRERDGSPTFLNIELARELSRDFRERNQMKKQQDDNRKENERRMERIREDYGKVSPTGLDLVKLRLYEEQGGICAYSQKPISAEHLFDANYAEVDHIVPYSISFDDGYKNKVLVLAKENRDKGNRLPLEYLSGQRREDFIVWVNATVRDAKKRERLLKERVTEEERRGMRERSLQDTKTMSVFLLNYIRDHLQFAPFESGRKKHVTAVNGAVTAYLRKRWGIAKVRANGDLHHAVDALVVACTTDGMIQAVSRYAERVENRYTQEEGSRFVVDRRTGEVVREFPYPWEEFRHELAARLSSDPAAAVMGLHLPLYISGDIPVRPLFVSRMPNRKVTGAAHKETVKGVSEAAPGELIVKKPLTELKLKDGEIENYYRPQDDRLLYEALKAQLLRFGGDGKKAFSEPFYKPKSNGTQGPPVKKVKLREPSTLNVPLHGGTGAADNGGMVRLDIFFVPGDGYYFVPIYASDVVRPALPNRACVGGKPYDVWKEMRPEDFLFTLYPGDLIRVTHKKALKLTVAQAESDLPESYETKSEFLYYISADISTGAITGSTHDSSYKIKGLGIKTLEGLEKYTVDMLGEYRPVKREPRLGFGGKG